MVRRTIGFLVLSLLLGCSSTPQMSPGVTQREAAQEMDAAGGNAPAPGKKQVERKIIYTASLHLVVDDFAAASDQLEGILKEQKGALIERADLSGSPGSPRHGTWKLRVPADQLDTFLPRLRGLGEVTRSTLDASDVTAEYYDVDADIRNKKVEEEAFLNLEKTATTFDNLLAAKREVNRVRNEIDRLQKRMNVLNDLTTLATVNLTLQERKDYVPETTTFTGTIGRTWSDSWSALARFGRGLVVVAVAVTPWFLVLLALAVVLLPLRWLWRRPGKLSRPTSEPQGPTD